jgi:hypothetical protein
MPVRFVLADSFLQNGLDRLFDGLYLSILLGVVRIIMTMLKPQLGCYLFHHLFLKVTAIISDNLTWDTEPGDNLIEYEEGSNIPIIFNCRHGLGPPSKVVYGLDNVFMPPSRSWVSIHKVHPPLGEGTDGNDWMERG